MTALFNLTVKMTNICWTHEREPNKENPCETKQADTFFECQMVEMKSKSHKQLYGSIYLLETTQELGTSL